MEHTNFMGPLFSVFLGHPNAIRLDVASDDPFNALVISKRQYFDISIISAHPITPGLKYHSHCKSI